MIADMTIRNAVELNAPLVAQMTSTLFMQGDNLANTFEITVTKNGQPFDLTGYAGIIKMRRADGEVVETTGTVNDSVLTITLTEDFYQAPGQYAATIRIRKETTREKKTLLRLWGEVGNDGGQPTIIPGNKIPESVEDLLAMLDEMRQVTQEADEAADAANQAAKTANDAAEYAKVSADPVLAAIEQARQQSVADVEQAGQNVVNSLPLDYVQTVEKVSQLSEEIAELKNTLLTTETVTKTGTVVSVDAEPGAELTVTGEAAETVTLVRNGMNFLPSVGGNKAEPDYSYTLNEDGTIHFTGTPTVTRYVDICGSNKRVYLPAGSYMFTGSVTRNIKLVLQNYETKENISLLYINDTITLTQRKFTLSEGCVVSGNFEIKKDITYDETLWCQVVAWKDGDPVPEYEPCKREEKEVTLPATVDALEGTNIFYTTNGDELTVSMEKTIQNTSDGFDATVWGMPVLTLDGDCTGMTKDDSVSLTFTFKDKDGNALSGNADVKKQGSSSISTGEQIGAAFDTDLGGLFNFTIKFPEAFEAKAGWGKQKKYVFKANAIDHSHSRNVCSCKLWGEIVKSRANVPAELANLPNGGAIDGFPIIIVLNGKYYALGTFNIPKDGWMFGNPKAILCADVHSDATKFKALAKLDGSDFELEYVEDEDNAGWVLPSINRAIQAVMDSDGSDLDATVGQYIDIPSAIDYYIHTVDENANDGTDKNYILVTFDGVKWYFSAYDRDTVYGLNWDGKSINYPVAGIDYANYAEIHQLMHLIYMYARPTLKARAVELRNRIKSEVNVANVFTNFAAGIPAEVYAQNCRRWPLLRSTSVSNIAQILNWYRLRRAYLDARLDSWQV